MHSANLMIGFDRRMPDAYMVAAKSAYLRNQNLDISPLVLPHLRAIGVYKRQYISNSGSLYDVISQAPMATEFALSRFLIPYLHGYSGYTIFCDSDFLFLCDPLEVMRHVKPEHAVSVVKHDYSAIAGVKMDGQVQTSYPRKNWSSFMVFNNAHPANKALTLDRFNQEKGLYFHQFNWLKGCEIGELPLEYNYLVGISRLNCSPKVIHFTDGTPDMLGYENVEYADEWRKVVASI